MRCWVCGMFELNGGRCWLVGFMVCVGLLIVWYFIVIVGMFVFSVCNLGVLYMVECGWGSVLDVWWCGLCVVFWCWIVVCEIVGVVCMGVVVVCMCVVVISSFVFCFLFKVG